jgi:hypothetical protein
MDQRQANQADGRTFREQLRSEARFLWKLQWIGLPVLLAVFALFPLCPWSLLPWLQIVWLAAIAGFSYAFYRGCARVKCPRCGKRLAYLLEDKRVGCMRGTSVSGIPQGPVSREGLPEDLLSCPYCGHPFDAVVPAGTGADAE